MKVTAYCRHCHLPARFDAEATPDRLDCPRCGDVRPLEPTPALRSENRLDQCPVCSMGYFYREKDFNAWVGGAVILVAIVGFLVMAPRNLWIAMSFLATAALLDWIVYRIVPFRFVCYNCLASFHGAREDPKIGLYDLGTAGRFTDDYEQEREKRRE